MMNSYHECVNNIGTRKRFPLHFTVCYQDIHFSLLEYSEMDGDEELPLGQEFQEHLKCFIDEKQTKANLKFARAEKLIQQLA